MKNLLNSISNEPKFFEYLNLAVSTFVSCRNAEVLLVDKVHRYAFGYYGLNNFLRTHPDCSPEQVNRTLFLNGQNYSGRGGSISGTANPNNSLNNAFNSINNGIGPAGIDFDFKEPSIDVFGKRIELPYEEDSVLKYVIHNKEIVSFQTIPQVSLYNKRIDGPLANRQEGFNCTPEHNRSKIPRFMYFPLCSASKELIGIVRVFLDEDEQFDSNFGDSLSK